jgi:hypothetical protein
MSVLESGYLLLIKLDRMQCFYDDNERGAYVAHKNTAYDRVPDMAQVLKQIVIMTRNKGYEFVEQDDEEDDNYIIPEMYYEWPEDTYTDVDEDDEELIEAIEAEALEEYFEECYDGLFKSKFADA